MVENGVLLPCPLFSLLFFPPLPFPLFLPPPFPLFLPPFSPPSSLLPSLTLSPPQQYAIILSLNCISGEIVVENGVPLSPPFSFPSLTSFSLSSLSLSSSPPFPLSPSLPSSPPFLPSFLSLSPLYPFLPHFPSLPLANPPSAFFYPFSHVFRRFN